MNTKIRFFILNAVALMLTGCVSYYRISPVKDQKLSQEWQNGVSVSTSIMERSTVVLKVKPLVISDSYPELTVAVFNAADSRYDFSEKMISASVEGKALQVFGRDAWIIKSDKDARAQQIALGMAAAANAYSASQQNQSTLYTSWGTFNVYQSNYAQSALANAATAKVYSDISRDIKKEALDAVRFAESQMLSINTMAPKSWYGGSVILSRLPKLSGMDNQLVINVSVDNELHRFELVQSKADEPKLETKKRRRICGVGC